MLGKMSSTHRLHHHRSLSELLPHFKITPLFLKFSLLLFFSVLLLMAVPSVFAESSINLTEGVTSISRDIYGLHMLIFWVCVVIAVIVFGAMGYSIYAHRKSKGAKASNFHESTAIEFAWTLIPLAILIAIAVPATGTLIDLENTENADMTIKITGYQWKWQYEYMDGDANSTGVSFFSVLADKHLAATKDDEAREKLGKIYLLDVDKPLVLPINTRIRFLMTSKDVIHSWWVRDLGVKQDANPGFINDSWATIDKVGTYRGQCAELCGKDHGFMPIVVEAKTKEDYATWVGEQKVAQAAAIAAGDKEWSKEDLMAQGKKVYDKTCVACHGATGAGIPPAFPPIANSPIVKGDVKAHIAIVMDGKAATAMQAFKAQLTDADLAAVITYERNAFGNNTGDVVQPSTIKSAR